MTASSSDTARSVDATGSSDAKPNSEANGGAPAEAQDSGGESAGTVIVAGVVNLGIALGLFLEHLTGDPVWDGLSAIVIGLLLIVVATVLARANVSLLIGQSASPRLQAELKAEIAELDHVVDVPFLLTSVIGPAQLLVAAKVDFDDDVSAGEIERISDEAERRLVGRHEGVRYVFLDPTAGDGRARAQVHPPTDGRNA